MHRLQWIGFNSWLQRNGHQDNSMLLVSAIEDIRKEFSTEKFNRLLSMPDFLAIFYLYKEYCKGDNGPLKVFWNSYLEMVEVLMNFVQATREENWDLHLECIKEMLPWFFAYDHKLCSLSSSVLGPNDVATRKSPRGTCSSVEW